jgi:preprotein translocase subunit SecE
MSIMDVKLRGTSSGEESKDTHSKKKFSLFTFISELKDEMKKVSWTSKKELVFSTKMVLLSMFVFGFSIYLVDLCIKGVLEMLKAAVHYIAS